MKGNKGYLSQELFSPKRRDRVVKVCHVQLFLNLFKHMHLSCTAARVNLKSTVNRKLN